ncbi:MAG TPA: acyclic terpene utilization AtuA family protein [Pirellulales bacterium]|nr:acyclic terpene utilization AtuA family protein [Pirellulales bacterium]
MLLPPLRIANGAGFLGDNLDAPRLVVEAGGVDYLTLEYLAELTLSILARAREKDPAAGYARDFITVLKSLCPALVAQPQLRIVTNAGGMNPIACARAAAEVLRDAGIVDAVIGVVTGDDILGRLQEIQDGGCDLENLDTGRPLAELASQAGKPDLRAIVSANVYLGATPIAEALAAGARIVITGRVADASLTVGPATFEFGWKWDDWNALAGASVAGHLIECGAQATGGLYRHWQSLDLANVGYPIAELMADGTATITKPPGTGGAVTRQTVAEQLVYEIGDPAHYLTPDVDVDFTTVELSETGPDRVSVRGATGRPAPQTYKASLAYRAGYSASGQLLVYGHDCVSKSRQCADMILRRVARAGYTFEASHVECLGAAASVPGLHPPPADLREVVLRLTVRDPRREAVERFTAEFAPLITSGPPGLAGYAAGRPAVRPVLAYWPALVPRNLIAAKVECRSAADWIE